MDILCLYADICQSVFLKLNRSTIYYNHKHIFESTGTSIQNEDGGQKVC